MVLSTLNGTTNSSFTGTEDVTTAIYLATAISHIILVIIPCLILGTIVISILVIRFKKSKDANTAVFISIAVLCTAAPSTYGLLMDVSLITDEPILGKCPDSVFWVFIYFSNISLLLCNVLLSIVQFIAVKGLYKKHLLKATAFTLLALFVLTLTMALLEIIPGYFESVIEARGSLCALFGKSYEFSFIIGGVIVVFVMLPSFTTVAVFSALTYRHVKRNTIDNENVVKSVLKVMIFNTVTAVFFRFLPATTFFFRFDDELLLVAVSWTINYSSELVYPLHLLFIVNVHKTVRKSIVEKMKFLQSSVKKFTHHKVVPVRK